ncbi:MAG: SpoIIE family protein phosphatase [Chloroflexi bacterium]|nr:SpoIIE family protein phosphatase [Chloroflexota bacterium]
MSLKLSDPRANILIVDDTPDNLRLLTQILGEHCYQVRVATSGERALASIKLAPPDLILLDIKMPGMDGFAVCQALKADSAARDIPVIFISALDDVSDKVRAFATGGVDYVTKPFQGEEVLARVETHLTLRNLQKQLERANQKMIQELALAGQVQASFLPDKLPDVPGWQFSVSLLPARETSGDFYDAFLLPDGRLGILVADVVDKGVCAALFMSLVYALFRTHALEECQEPACVFRAMNERILHDTHGNQFVTAFYGILDPKTGQMVYSNAGHCPALILKTNDAAHTTWLCHTGVPLGALEDMSWGQEKAYFAPGDVLVLYSDGLIEAENGVRELFGRQGLLACAKARVGHTAAQIKEGIINDVQQFTGDVHLLDDLVLLVGSRALENDLGVNNIMLR